jgi:hypothetical protein
VLYREVPDDIRSDLIEAVSSAPQSILFKDGRPLEEIASEQKKVLVEIEKGKCHAWSWTSSKSCMPTSGRSSL